MRIAILAGGLGWALVVMLAMGLGGCSGVRTAMGDCAGINRAQLRVDPKTGMGEADVCFGKDVEDVAFEVTTARGDHASYRAGKAAASGPRGVEAESDQALGAGALDAAKSIVPDLMQGLARP